MVSIECSEILSGLDPCLLYPVTLLYVMYMFLYPLNTGTHGIFAQLFHPITALHSKVGRALDAPVQLSARLYGGRSPVVITREPARKTTTAASLQCSDSGVVLLSIQPLVSFLHTFLPRCLRHGENTKNSTERSGSQTLC